MLQSRLLDSGQKAGLHGRVRSHDSGPNLRPRASMEYRGSSILQALSDVSTLHNEGTVVSEPYVG